MGGRDSKGVWDGQVHMLYLKWLTNRSYRIAQGTLLNVIWQPGWEGSLGENGYMHMYESLCCSPDTVTTSFMRYNPLQTKKLKKKKKKRSPPHGKFSLISHVAES